MIHIENTLISDDLAGLRFACDLSCCRGACCVEGDAGAPLEMEEISLLEDYVDQVKPFMTEQGIRTINEQGVFDYDTRGNFVTPLVNGKECAFVYFEDQVARCSIEKAFENKQVSFRKPVSCHLYPVRITTYSLYDAVNYHRWHICDNALAKGKTEGIYLYQFLKDALIRKYGAEWYEELCHSIEKR
ncbi:MAG: DUF3109 family protein [Bacteroidales bacterium]|nr:DUF3109 family protein [Lentimicrobiaceae bacterium]MDD5695307.1 DUF3109 family protein [Bacteroidales bacterium]